MKYNVECRTEKDLEALAQRIADCCPKQCFMALHGDLGTGKTTFVKYLGRHWGILSRIKSPSFDVIHVHHGQRTLIHMDAYRLQDQASLEALMIDDLCQPPFCFVVEWPERLPIPLPFQIQLYFSISPLMYRWIQVEESPAFHGH